MAELIAVDDLAGGVLAAEPWCSGNVKAVDGLPLAVPANLALDDDSLLHREFMPHQRSGERVPIDDAPPPAGMIELFVLSRGELGQVLARVGKDTLPGPDVFHAGLVAATEQAEMPTEVIWVFAADHLRPACSREADEGLQHVIGDRLGQDQQEVEVRSTAPLRFQFPDQRAVGELADHALQKNVQMLFANPGTGKFLGIRQCPEGDLIVFNLGLIYLIQEIEQELATFAGELGDRLPPTAAYLALSGHLHSHVACTDCKGE